MADFLRGMGIRYHSSGVHLRSGSDHSQDTAYRKCLAGRFLKTQVIFSQLLISSGRAQHFVVGEGSALIKDGKYNLTSPEVIKAAEDYNFVASRAPKGVSTEMLRQLFVDGKVAMIIDGSFVVPLLETADEDIKPYLKVAKTPFEYTPGTISNSLHMSANLSDERKALVWEFMQQVASPENQVLYANYTQGPCGRLSSSEGISDPMIAFMNEVGADTRSILPDSANLMRNYSRFTDTVITYVLQLQNEGADVAGIMAALEADLLKNSLEP